MQKITTPKAFKDAAAKIRLGDAVHAVAHPVARVIDAATAAAGAPTNVAGCGGCAKRRAALNALTAPKPPEFPHP